MANANPTIPALEDDYAQNLPAELGRSHHPGAKAQLPILIVIVVIVIIVVVIVVIVISFHHTPHAATAAGPVPGPKGPSIRAVRLLQTGHRLRTSPSSLALLRSWNRESIRLFGSRPSMAVPAIAAIRGPCMGGAVVRQ